MTLAIAVTVVRASWLRALVTNLPPRSLVQVVDVAFGRETPLTHAVENTSHGLALVGPPRFITPGISPVEAL